MKSGARFSFMLGLAALIALLVWQGVGEVTGMLVTAGLGLFAVTAFHLIPMLSSSICWRVLLPATYQLPLPRFLIARWIGESINSMLPVAQIGGEFAKARWIMQHGIPGDAAGSSVVVEVTVSLLTQIIFTMIGMATLLFYLDLNSDLVIEIAIGMSLMVVLLIAFYLSQRQRLFGKSASLIHKIAGGEQWLFLSGGAAKLDQAVLEIYRHKKVVAAASAWRLGSWIIGTGEVWLIMHFLVQTVSLPEALLLESLGQAIRAAGFLIPGSMGVQEGGFLLLGSVLGIPPQTALALSLAKRVRELMLGIPGLIVWGLNRSSPSNILSESH